MRKKFVTLTATLSVMALTTGAGVSAQPGDGLKKSYAAALQVSEEDVDEILQKQHEAMLLSGELEKAVPDDFAGMRISPSRNFSATIYLKSGDPSVISQFTTNPVYKVRKAKRSLSELNAILTQVRSVLNASGVNYGAFVDLDQQDIQVSVPDLKAVRPLIKTLEDKQEIRLVEEDITLVPTVMAGESAAIGSYKCTTGYSVQHTDGRKGTLTAGHCPNSAMTVGSTSSISYVASLLNSTNQRDVQWHSKSTGTFTSDLKVTGGTNLKVNGDITPSVGAVVCMNGQTSGNKCGKILSLGFSGNSAELTAPSTPIPVADGVVIEATTPGTQMCAEGDSGGPVYSTTWNYLGEAFALGIEFAGLAAYRIGTSTPKKFSRCVFAKTDVLSTLGLSLITNAPLP